MTESVGTASETDQAWFRRLFDLASREFGTTVLYASNEFFAAAENLLNPAKAVFIPDKYTENGKWMDGWETARHGLLKRGGRDFCLIKLGVPGSVMGVDIDTLHFTGNYAEYASIEACNVKGDLPWWRLLDEDVKWTEIVPRVKLGAGVPGTNNNYFSIPESLQSEWTHIRFNMYPDGGIARLRLYGLVSVPRSIPRDLLFDAAAMVNGGLPLACSDMYFSDVKHLSMFGRGENMGDGWETKRSRGAGHNDWAVVKLGRRTAVKAIEVDTHWFKGNPPHQCTIEIADSADETLHKQVMTFDFSSLDWKPLVPTMGLLPNMQHLFRAEIIAENAVGNIVRLSVFPDGGVMRLHVWGHAAE